MRADTNNFVLVNSAKSKRPRYTIEVAFDSANTILWYFTSHIDAQVPPGGSAIAQVVEEISGTSQTLTPDKATASIGNITFRLTDAAKAVTNQLGSQLQLGRSTRRQRVRVYVGYEGMAWSDYSLVQTQLVTDIQYDEGSYIFRCMDVQRAMRKTIFTHAKTTMQATALAGDSTISVYDTSQFQMLMHGSSYGEAQNATVGYIKIQDEVIRYTGTTPTSFTGCTRGALNTRAVDHTVDQTSTADRRTQVEEYVYVEMPAIKAAYAFLTGRMPPMPLALSATPLAHDYTSWVAGVTPTNWAPNQTTAGEATWQVRVGPDGVNSEVVHCCQSLDTNIGDPGGDGGWTISPSVGFPVDATKPYVFACFFKRLSTGVMLSASTYWGLHSNGTNDIKNLNGTDNGNPYFIGTATATVLPNADQWYLIIGMVHESSYGSVDTGISGVYDLNGNKVVNATEFKWQANSTMAGHRAYHYYNQLISGEIQQMARPRVWQCSPADAPALIQAICNSVALMPTTWNLGIDPAYVQDADFTNKLDLYDPRNDDDGLILRFEDLDQEDGKEFIETQVNLVLGCFSPIYANGKLGLRRMNNILSGAAYSRELNDGNVVSIDPMVLDFDSLHNIIQITWNWEPLAQGYTRSNVLVDGNSVTIHGKSDPYNLSFRGLHGSRHSSAMIALRFDALRDRYSGPPLKLPLTCVPSLNNIEVGDVVRVRLPKVRDFVANGTLDRSFEVQGVQIDWVNGDVKLALFASSQAPGALAPTSDATVLPNSWYTSQGTDLSTVLTITGSNPGHISAGGTITGSADMNSAPSIFYYNGDLQLDVGVAVNITGNVQLRIKGFFQNNGTINGKAGGYAGAATSPLTSPTSFNAGTQGFIGTTEPGGAIYLHRPKTTGFLSLLNTWIDSYRGNVIAGLNSTMPSLNLGWDGTTLSGIPSDMRGSSGSSGLNMWCDDPDYAPFGFGTQKAGGAGGASGAGLIVVSRGFAQGVNGKIDLSGADGSLGSFLDTSWGLGGAHRIYAGSGAGGAPGALAVILDGSGNSATGLNDAGFVAFNGATPAAPGPVQSSAFLFQINGSDAASVNASLSSYFVGTGDGTAFPLPNLSGARGGSRVQYVPNNSTGTINADPSEQILSMPSNLSLASGTTELLTSSDGTVQVRIKAAWNASPDARTVGYDLQFKKSSDSLWINAPSVVGSTTGWCVGVQDGVQYDVQVRAADADRNVSPWLTLTNYTVIGKTAPPSDVGSLSYTDPVLTWSAITDPDRQGYVVRYAMGASFNWATATPAHADEYVTPTRFDTSFLVGGQVTFGVRSRDTSKNLSNGVSTITVDLRPATPASFLISRQADGTRQFDWATTIPPSDLDGARIRYLLGAATDWTLMTPMHQGVLKASPFETNQLAAGTYTFAIKNVDGAGNESANALFIGPVTIGDPRIAGALGDFTENPAWAGTKYDCHID